MTDFRRLTSHPVFNDFIENRKTVTITVDGRSLNVPEGEILAAALWVNDYICLGHNPADGAHRGIYCGIGHCYECRVTVDGIEDVRSCLIPVRDGMRVQLTTKEMNGESSRGGL